jgi:hypothetical protein
MNAKDLRIGNWYMFADNEGICYRTIKEIKHNDFGFFSDFDGVNFGICKPIPLTEEWLLKFGFSEMLYGWWSNKIFLTKDENGGIWFYYNGTTQTEAFELKSVQQLQNLYFALTGEELTIKN